MKVRFILLLCVPFVFCRCDVAQQVAKGALDYYSTTPSTQEMQGGLSEALLQGIEGSVTLLSADKAFLNDPLLAIGFPEEIKVVDETLRKIGLGSISDAFVTELNKGAEKAVVKALPIFKDAVKNMTFQDASGILLGDQYAATEYLKSVSSEALLAAFRPDVEKVLSQFGIDKSYSSLMQKYNTIPFVKQIETDLAGYVTQKTMDGLFLKVAQEEAGIRSDLGLRSSDLMKKVFSYADRMK